MTDPTTNRRIIPLSLMAFLLGIQAILLGYLSWSTSPNRTEIGHLGAAVYFWHTGKFDVFHVNPPLTRFIAGAPIALFCNPKHDWSGYSPRPQDRCEWALGNAFVAANDLDDLRLYTFLARLVCIPLVLLGGYFGYRFASELYGEWSGIMFLILWTFSPLVLGWGATICPDVAAASMGIVGLYTFWHWLKTPTWWRAIIAGICLGLMPLTKMTWIVAFPIWCLLFALWKIGRKQENRYLPWKQFGSILLLAVYVINSGYFYDGSFRQLKNYEFISGTLTGVEMTKETPVKQENRFTNSWMGNILVPFPAEFVQGIDTQKMDFERGMESYARGVWSDKGFWWYYGYALLLKEPLGVWALAILAVSASCFCRGFNSSIQDEVTILIPMFLIFAFISSQTGFSLHTRYVILILPLLYIFISKIVSIRPKKRRPALLALAGIFLAWVVGSSLWLYPHSTSYFNELAGKPQNWSNHLLGSNIEWGQGGYDLAAWVNEHPEANPLYISYLSTIPLKKLGIESEGEVPAEPTAGWMVIGVNEFFENKEKFAWVKTEKDMWTIGHSVWIFNIKDDNPIHSNEL